MQGRKGGKEMKLPWYMKSDKDGTEIHFHWAWVYFQSVKMLIQKIFTRKRKT